MTTVVVWLLLGVLYEVITMPQGGIPIFLEMIDKESEKRGISKRTGRNIASFMVFLLILFWPLQIIRRIRRGK